MDERVEPKPASAGVRGPELTPRARRALREARTEAAVVLVLDVALLAGLAVVDRRKAGRSSTFRGGCGSGSPRPPSS